MGEREQARFQAAVEAYLAYCAQDLREPAAEFLAKHESLRDLLEPMLDGAHSLCFYSESWIDDAKEPQSDANQIAHYRIIEELGRGGQGIVYRAEDTRLHRNVALKVLTAGGAQSLSMRTRLMREAEAASKLDHPGICGVYEVGEHNGLPFIAMRYLDGKTLDRVITESKGEASGVPYISIGSEQGTEQARATESDSSASGPRTLNAIHNAVRLIEQAARALHIAHEAGLTHRDIKPGNILVTADGDPVILDFGIARDETTDAPTLTQTGQLMGTPAYMAPEQIAAKRITVDRRADVYSLGVTLFECLTLKRPFEAPTREGLYQAIMAKDPPDPRSLNPMISRDLVAVIETALDKDRDRRYQTAEMFAEDLAAVRDGRPVSVKAISRIGRVIRWARRKPAEAALVAVIAIGLPLAVGAGVGAFAFAKWDDIQRGEQEERRQIVEGFLATGYLELGEGAPRKAIHSFEQAIAHAKETPPEAVAGLALTYLELKDAEGATRALKRYRSTIAQHDVLQLIRADVLRAGDEHRAAKELERRFGPPRNALGFFIHGTRAIARGHDGDETAFHEALDLFTRAIVHSERAPAVYFFERAHAAGHCKDARVAKDTVAVLRTRWPNSLAAWFWCGFAQMDTDPEKAIAAYKESLRLAPDHAQVISNLGVLYDRKGRFDEAIAAFRRAYRLEPDYAVYPFNLANTYKKMGLLDEAIAAYKEALRLQPNHAGCVFNLARTFEKKGLLDEALAAYSEASRLRPEDGRAQYHLGFLYGKSGRLDKAIAAFEEAIRLKPDYAEAHSNLGRAYLGKDLVDEAIEASTKAVRLKPDYAEAHNNLGVAYAAKNLHDKAIAAFKEAVRLRPDYATAYSNLGLTYSTKGLHDEAIAASNEALRIQPDLAEAQLHLGIAYGRNGQLGEGIAAYKKALRLKPDLPKAHYNLGLIYGREGRIDDAVAAFRQAVRLRPRYAEALCGLGTALLDKNQWAEALVMLRKGHDLGSRRANWDLPSGRLLADCERRVLLAARSSARVGLATQLGEAADRQATLQRHEAANTLKELLGGWRESLGTRENQDRIRSLLKRLKQDGVFLQLRHPDTIASFPESEQETWRGIWALMDAVWSEANEK